MNALEQRLAEYQNGGTFPDYQELIELAEKLHDEPQPVKYVDVEEVIDLVVGYHNELMASLAYQSVSQVFSHIDSSKEKLEKIRALLAPHQIEQPEQARYVDVPKAMTLAAQYANCMAAAEQHIFTGRDRIYRAEGQSSLKQLQELLAPHELKRLSDEDIDSLLIDYNELILDQSHLSAPEAMQLIIRRVESKVRGEE